MNNFEVNIRETTRVFAVLGTVFLWLFFANDALAHGMSDAEKQSIIEGGNWRFLWLGATHMLSGYDHLAFVFGIVFFLTTFRDVAKYVTAFTVGHSVTLIFATFNAIQVNYFLIDAVIGLSVCYIAFSNLDGFRKYLNVNPPNMLMMIFSLGLIHGLGLSTRLQMLPLSDDHLLMNIISFNVGIELGQIAALVVMLVLIAAWRHTQFFKTFSVMTNCALMLLGGLLFLMQMHGYEHTANASEYAQTMSVSEPEQDQRVWRDTKRIVIPPMGDLEYKIYVIKGQTFSFQWQTDGEHVFFDFHGEPDGDNTGYFESFEENTLRQSSGEHTATFSGTHGWYWKNSTGTPVVITLNTQGDYQSADTKFQRPKKPASEPEKAHESMFKLGR